MVLDKDGTYFEDLIYGSFKIDIVDLISLKAALSKAFHIQPSEIDRMPFWELEIYTKELERLVKEESEQQKHEMDKSGAKDAMKMTKPGYMQNMMKGTSDAMPKMPNMNMNMPKTITMPTYRM